MRLRSVLHRQWSMLSFFGVAFGTLFFAASLTPSLLPRPWVVQGILSGMAMSVGYALGVGAVWAWQWLELPRPGERLDRAAKQVTAVAAAVTAIGFLWRSAVWQNSIRELMEMPPVETGYPLRVCLIAAVVAALMVLAARGVIKSCLVVSDKLHRVLPRRVATALGSLVVVVLLVLAANDLILKGLLHAADGIALKFDQATDEGIDQPAEPLACGSAESLVEWDSIGRQGKNFIAAGPTQDGISEFWGRETPRPLRVYVGLGSRPTEELRAKLALEELIRVGGFDRKVLIVATPTGTGWLDPGAVDTVEYIHGGDTAIVSMQYSYLPSWMTILVDPERARVSAQALFDEIYAHWTKLPTDDRPRLYLHGLSLGAFGAETSADLITLLEDPIHGALFSGAPFPSRVWRSLVDHRKPDTPEWLPRFRDGSMIRFTGQEDSLDEAGDRWGPLRVVYIQHASDPMVWFSESLPWRRPAWLVGKRGPDVSPYLKWRPIVTFLQIAWDLPMATSVPIGYGHNYAPHSYIDGWVAVSAPTGWDAEQTERLKEQFATDGD
ncbi:MAG: alpha/beta-hydrolase family protein [Planctomycetales bacterium]|nr:alpha/beta-hydrolase family protein [Planctomycetales bacterium]